MPFYLMPTLGGNDTLRGFRAYRFRGPHAMLLQGEYRFELWSGLDAALFYDAGKVAMSRQRPQLQRPRVRLWLRVPLQHRRRHDFPRRCRLRQPRWQASLDGLRWHVLVAAGRAARWCVAALLARHRPRARRHAAPLPRRSDLGRRRHGARRLGRRRDRGRQQLRLPRQHDVQPRGAARRAGAERQHRRRGARLELVPESGRPSDRRRPTSCAGRIACRRSRSTAGWSAAASAAACSRVSG